MPLDPASRMVRAILAEKGLPAQLVETRPWDNDGALAAANPADEIPVLIDEPAVGREIAVCPAMVIVGISRRHLSDAYGVSTKIPPDRAEARRLCAWFCDKFERDVISQAWCASPSTSALCDAARPTTKRAKAIGLEALSWHMDYFNWLLEQRTWFAGVNKLCVADLAGAGFLSAVDYVDAACPGQSFQPSKTGMPA